MRHLAACLWLLACTEPAVHEDPVIDPSPTTRCGPSARLVRDACTRLGSNDACVETRDVCIALCDQLATCATVGGLRVLDGFPVAPDGYCVECASARTATAVLD